MKKRIQIPLTYNLANHSNANVNPRFWSLPSMRAMSSLFTIFSLTMFFMVQSVDVSATHFRYSQITWAPDPATPGKIDFTIVSAWRRNFQSNWNTVGSTISLGPTFRFGDGTSMSMTGVITSENIAEDWIQTTSTFSHTYTTSNNFNVYYSGCCRISELINAPDDFFEEQTIVNVDLTNWANNNRPPNSSLPPIVNIQQGMVNGLFTVPGFDPDGDNLNFRLATFSESEMNNPTGFTIDASGNVTFTFPAGGFTMDDLYAAAVVIEDLDGSNNVKSKTVVDFIIKVVGTSQPPAFVSPTPASGFTYTVNPGTAVNFTVAADDPDPNALVIISVTGLPGTATLSTSNPTPAADPVSTDFSWNPTTADVGTYTVSFAASDEFGVQVFTNVVINVSSAPNFIAPTLGNNSLICNVPQGAFSEEYKAEDANLLETVTLSYVVNPTLPPTPLPVPPPTPGGGFPGMSALPPSLSFSPGLPTPTGANPISSTLSGNIIGSDWGIYNLEVTATDNLGQSSTVTNRFIINQDPFFTSPAPATNVIAALGAPFTLVITADDMDIPFGDRIAFAPASHSTVTVPSWVTMTDDGMGNLTLSGTPALADVGVHPTTIELHDRTTHFLHTHCSQQFQSFNIEVVACGPGEIELPELICAPSTQTPAPLSTVTIGTSQIWDNNATATDDPSELGDCKGRVSFKTPAIADNCPFGQDPLRMITTFESDPPVSTVVSPDTDITVSFLKGSTLVKFEVTDAAGNMNDPTLICDFTVVVEDDQDPVFTYDNDIDLTTSAGATCPSAAIVSGISAGSAYTWGDAFTVAGIAQTAPPVTAYSDNCEPKYTLEVASIVNSSSVCPKTITITWKVIDCGGNEDTAEQVFTITDDTDPIVTAPGDADAECDDDLSPANQGTATATDNCSAVGDITITHSDASTQGTDNTDCSFYEYVITRTWTATDECGMNIASEDQTITVTDDTDPVVSAPANATVNCQDDMSPVALGTATAMDTCDPNPAVTYADTDDQNPDPSDCGHYNYTITRTWFGTDVCGNVGTANQIITVQDVTAPTVTPPANATANCEDDLNPTGQGMATASDNCDTNPTITYADTDNQDPDTDACGHYNYTITRTWTATDACGISGTAIQTITVKDDTNPVVTAPADATANCEDDLDLISLGSPTGTDNCDNDLTFTYMDDKSAQGTDPTLCDYYNYDVIRTWTGTDACGNAGTAMQTITVQDVTNPTVTAPSNTNASCEDDLSPTAQGTGTATDNCDPNPAVNYTDMSTQDPDPTVCGHYDYTITRTWTGTDVCGNAGDDVQTITVDDNTDPVAVAANPVDGNNDPIPFIIDMNCQVTISAEDLEIGGGNMSSDNCVANENLRYQIRSLNQNGGVSSGWSDQVTLSQGGGNQEFNFNNGCPVTANVRYRVIDVCGNISVPITVVVTIKDETDPTWDSALPQTADYTGANASPTSTTACGNQVDIPIPDYSDNCTDEVDISLSIVASPGVLPGAITGAFGNRVWEIIFPLGVSDVTFTITDECGNDISHSFQVEVVDNVPPVMSGFSTCPSDYTVATGTDDDECFATVELNDPFFSDFCGLVIMDVEFESDPSDPTKDDQVNSIVSYGPDNVQGGEVHDVLFYNGTTIVTYQVQDEAGNVNADCSYKVTVIDDQDPVLAAQVQVDLDTENGSVCPVIATVDWMGLDVADLAWSASFEVGGIAATTPSLADLDENCPDYVLSATVAEDDMACTETITITWLVTDCDGNTDSEDQVYTITDNTDPTWVNEPANMTVECDGTADPSSAFAAWLTSFSGTDNCGTAAVTHNSTGLSDDCGATGSETVTFTLTDECGLAITKDATFTIVDTTDPEWAIEPSDMIVECDGTADPAGAFATWLMSFSGTDACGSASVTHNSTGLSDDCGATGAETVTFTLTDECGLSITKDATFTIVDTTDPVWVDEPADMTVECDGSPDPAGAFAAWLMSFSGTDACGSASVTHNSTGLSDGCGATGAETVIFTLTDECGLSITKDATFTILDTTDPTWAIEPADMTVECDGSSDPGGAFAIWLMSFSGVDACGTATVTHNSPGLSDDCGATGAETVTFTLTDECGLAITKDATFTIVDMTNPVWVDEPDDMIVECDDTSDAAFAAWLISFSGSDVCGSATVTHNSTGLSDDCGDTGSETVTFTLTDECGLSITKDATFTIEDTTDPEWDVEPSDMTVECDGTPDPSGAFAAWLASFSGVDDCASATVTNNSVGLSDDCGATGTETVTFTLTDECGLSITKDATFTIVDTTDPTFDSVLPGDETINATTTDCEATIDIVVPAFSDACTDMMFSNIVISFSDPNVPIPGINNGILPGMNTPVNYWEIDNLSVGMTTVTITITDDCGNDIDHSFVVTVIDVTPPTVKFCPADQTVSTEPDVCNAVVDWKNPTGSDNCTLSEFNISFGPESGDPDAPTSFPSDIMYTGAEVAGAQDESATFEKGVTVVTFTFEDEAGMMSSCEMRVTIEDNQAPVLAAQDQVDLDTENGSVCPNTATVDWLTLDETDLDWGAAFEVGGMAATTPSLADLDENCPDYILSATVVEDDMACTETITITWLVTDCDGNTDSKDQVYTITDKSAPQLVGTIPSDESGLNLCLADAPVGPSEADIAVLYSDNCGNVNVTKSGAPSGTDCSWTAAYTYNIVDDCMNSAASITITYTGGDTEAPTLAGTLPGDQTGLNLCLADAPAGPSEADIAALYTDNCGDVNVTKSEATTGTDCSWKVMYTYDIVDDCTNAISITITYSGGDTEAPVLVGTIPSDESDFNLCMNEAPVGPSEADIAALYTDNCGDVNVTKSGAPSGTDCSWTAAYTYDIVDDCTNAATSITITFSGGDTEAPVLAGTIPSDESDLNLCMADAPVGPSEADIAALYTDNCGDVNVTKSGAPSGTDCSWTAAYTYDIVDDCTNAATSITITFSGGDTEAPALVGTVPSDESDLNLCMSEAPVGPSEADIAALYTDNCGTVNVTKSGAPTGTDCSWTAAYIYDIEDDCTNAATSITITYSGSDQDDPTFDSTLPGDETITAATTDCEATIDIIVPDFSDDCTVMNNGNISISFSDANVSIPGISNGTLPGTSSPVDYWEIDNLSVGVTTVTITITDDCGNDIDHSFDVTVIDDTVPSTGNCPVDQTVSTESGVCNADVSWVNATGTDNCDLSEFNVTFSAVSGDLSPPSAFPTDLNYIGAAVAGGQPVSAVFEEGVTMITFAFTDLNGLTGDCSMLVTVEDDEDPVAACKDITIELASDGLVSITAADLEDGSTDNCGVDLSLSTIDVDMFDCDDTAGPVTVTMTVVDVNGNISECTSQVTVEDNTDPVAGCQDVTVQLDANGVGSIVAADVEAGSTDACGIDPSSLSIDISTFDCDDLAAPVTVTLTVSDNNGNSDDCTAQVTVEDNQPAVATCQDLTVELDAAGTVTITAADIDGGSLDACGSASGSVSPSTFTCNEVGPNTVTLTITDSNNNTSMCDATVTVEDNVAPDALCQDITIELDAAGAASLTAAEVDNGSSDACGLMPLAIDVTAFDCTNVGPNTVTLTATDVNSNESTCTSTITVEDNIDPSPQCQDVTVELDDVGSASITSADVDNGSSDACDIASLVLSVTDFTCNEIGDQTVTLTVTDTNGNSDACSAIVTVEDNILPAAICQDITISLDGDGLATIVAADVDGGSSDNCSVTGSIDISSFDCDDIGSNPVVLTVTDPGGNTDDCTAIVTMEDATGPTFTCVNLGPFVVSTTDCNLSVPIDFPADLADNCSNVLDIVWSLPEVVNGPTISFFEFDDYWSGEFPLGITEVQLEATDAAGNLTTCIMTVEVRDITDPSVLCEDITVELNGDGVAEISSNDILIESDDNCGAPDITITPSIFDCSDIGDVDVNVTADDGNGNVVNCTATVTVEDNMSPVIVLNGTSTVILSCGSPYVEEGAVVTDNCDTGLTATITGTVDDTTPGVYQLSYDAVDAQGNAAATVVREVIVDDQFNGISVPTITGPSVVCAGKDGYVFSIPSIPGNATIVWSHTLGAGASVIAAGQGSSSITVNFFDDASISDGFGITDGNGSSAGVIEVTITGGCAPITASFPISFFDDELCSIYNCFLDLHVNDALTLPIADSPEVYQADQCISSDGTVQAGRNVEYNAGQCVELLPGFEVELTADFLADIVPCVSQSFRSVEADALIHALEKEGIKLDRNLLEIRN